MPKAGIYIHMPFCRVKCMYCDFFSVSDRDDAIPTYFEALKQEIELCTIPTSHLEIDTIFIGGGTPSLTPPNHLEVLIDLLNDRFDLNNITEFTMEANPGEAPIAHLRAYREMGVNRISIGVQSLEPDLLKFLTRIHGPQEVFETFDSLREAGFENINCDLIFNIPGQTKEIWERDIIRIIDLKPKHLSCYSLTVEEGTQLYQYVNRGKVIMPSNDNSAELYKWTQDVLENNGFQQYEISNWSKPNFKCKHNHHYWEIQPYLAFGPSAHGFDGKNRFSNIRNLDEYIKVLSNGKLPRNNEYELSDKDKTNELIGFGLRIEKGIDITKIPETYLDRVYLSIKQNESKWGNYFLRTHKGLSLTPEGYSYADAIAVDMMIE